MVADNVLEQALRDKVKELRKSGKVDDLTVRRVRVAVEKKLHLAEDYFKGDDWKDKSKKIIEDAAVSPASSEFSRSSIDIIRLARSLRRRRLPPISNQAQV